MWHKWGKTNTCTILVEKLEERDHIEDLSVDGILTLRSLTTYIYVVQHR
jgi:hypothetical protein